MVKIDSAGKDLPPPRDITSRKKSTKKVLGGQRICWDGHVVRIFKSVASDQCLLKKGSLKVLSSMLDDMVMRLGAEAATLCKIRGQMTMQPTAISRAISLVCRRSELGQIMINDGHKALIRYKPAE